MDLAAKHLGPPRRGIEIGASAINPFPGVVAWNVDLPGPSLFREAQERSGHAVARVDVAASADRLPFRAGSFDYVLASHVIEHMPDPIRALGEWDRVVRVGGTVFLIVPHVDRTQDAGRPLTDVRHLLADHALKRTVATDPLVPTSHYHVWNTETFLDLLRVLREGRFLAWDLVDVEPIDSKVGNGFTIVARKTRDLPPPRDPGLTKAAFFLMELVLPFQTVHHAVQLIVEGPEFTAPKTAPRGPYRVHPIAPGFPPVARASFETMVGVPVSVPVITKVEVEGGVSVVTGRAFTDTTWLEVEQPDLKTQRVFPRLREDGALVLDVTGVDLPTVQVRVRAHNLPPGGGAGPWFFMQL